MESFLSRREFADKVGVSLDTVRRWERAGYFKVWRSPTGVIRIPLDEAERFMATREEVASVA